MNNLAFQIYGSTKSGIFQSTWDTTKTSTGSSASNQITLPLLSSGTYNFWIDWGDGSTTNVTSYSQRTHTYASAGTYTIRVTGTITGWGFQNTGDRLKILTITSWGKLKSLNQGFYGCSNVTMSGITDILDLTGTTSLAAMFSGCSKITTVGRMNEWDTSLVANMSNTFANCSLFNQPLSNWNTSSCVTFVNTFTGCGSFNQCIGSWNVIKSTSFEGMFNTCIIFNNGDNSAPLNNWILNTTAASVSLNYTFISCSSFNRYLGGWNTSKVNIMGDLFNGCTVFNNGSLSGIANQLPWDTSSVINMSKMFYQAPAFNSNLGTGTTPWDVSKVTSFTAMFNGASNFNNGDNSAPINNWNINTTAASVAMNQMFQSSKFNRYIGDWNVIKVTVMGNMFLSNTSFNQDLSKWNMGSVISTEAMFYNTNAFTNGSNTNTNPITGLTGINGWNINTTTSVNMTNMFGGATAFNQPIGSWNVSKVTNMAGMFFYAYAFNQPIGSWNVSSVTDFSNFMYGKSTFTFSSTNLDAIYNGWIVNGVQPNITISFGSAKYTSAGTAGRLTLTSAPNNWIIQDGGL